MMQTLFSLALSASQQQIKPHLPVAIDAQSLVLAPHYVIK